MNYCIKKLAPYLQVYKKVNKKLTKNPKFQLNFISTIKSKRMQQCLYKIK